MDHGASSYRRYLDGDESAFDEIMEAYSDHLIRFIYRFVGDMAAAEDIAIDTFADLIVHRHRYNFKVKLKTYLFMIGRSRALNYIKHRGRRQTVELSLAQWELPPEESPEETFFAGEEKRRLYAALNKLPEEMRMAVYLVYLEELSYEETARVMKKNCKQVDNLLYRAKNTLRTILDKEGTKL